MAKGGYISSLSLQKVNIVYLIMLVLMWAAPAAPQTPSAQDSEKTLSPYLFVQSDDPSVDHLPLLSTSANVTIAGVIADVVVTQTYKNDGSRPIEALYIFPASTRAAVYGMKMTIADRVVMAEIREREQARRAYEAAKQQGKSASLLEQHRPNVFQMNVANVMPGDLVVIELRYTELLVPHDGIYEFVYPTVVLPRYSNSSGSAQWAASRYQQEGETLSSTFHMRVHLVAGLPIQDIICPSHQTQMAYDRMNAATVELAPEEANGGNRDFVLRYVLAGGRIESGLLLAPGLDENFFLLMVQPPRHVEPESLPPREYIFIMDVSGSMSGFPIETSKTLLRNLLTRLRAIDSFNIIFFSGGNWTLSPQSLSATGENIRHALDQLSKQQGAGGTELLPALRNALAMYRTEGTSRTIVITTDGGVTVEAEAFDLIRENRGDANLFAFGIGNSVNRHLIEGLAHAGMGEPIVVASPEAAEANAARFLRYIELPVLAQIRVDYGGFDAYDVDPKESPDVFAQRPVVVIGKWHGPVRGAITVMGFGGAGPYSERINANNARILSESSALRYLWARQRIKTLADYNDNSFSFGAVARSEEAAKRRIQEVTQLGLQYNLLTPYTSFFAVDHTVRNYGQPQTVQQPQPKPQGGTNVQTDGVTANNVRWATGMNTPVNLNPEMVSEFRVIVSPVDSEMGRGSGQIQVVTRSGGNAYRGSVVWNIQNSALNARDWAGNKNNWPKTWRNKNEWIAQGSGPIIKNKTFIFALFDYTRAMSKETINPLMPTSCARKGIYRYFEGYGNGNTQQAAPVFTTASARGDAPYKIAVVDANGNPLINKLKLPSFMPATGSQWSKLKAINVFGDLPAGWNPELDSNCDQITLITDKSSQYYNFPGNINYATFGTTGAGSKYDKFRQRDTTGFVGKFMDLVQAPNNYTVGDGLNYGGYSWTRRNMGMDNVYGIGETPNRKQINIRADHNFNSRHRGSAVYTYETNRGDDAQRTMPEPYSYGGTVNRKPQTLSVTLTSTLKPSLLNEFRLGFMRTSSWVNGPTRQPETGAQLRELMYNLLPTGDWPGLQTSKIDIPILVSLPPYNIGNSANYHPYGSGRGAIGLDWGSTDPRWTFADIITWQFGRHSLRIGAEMQRAKSDLREDGNRYTFTPTASVYPLVQGGSASGATITGFDVASTSSGALNYSFPGQAGNGTNHNLADAKQMLDLYSGSIQSVAQYLFINSPTQTRYNNIADGEIYKQTLFYQNQINWFAQNNWRLADDLTLQFGMRWEWYGVPYLGNGMTAGFLGGPLSAFGLSGRGFDNWLTKKYDPVTDTDVAKAYKNCLNSAGQKVQCDLTTLMFIGPDSPHPEQNFYNDDYNNFGPVVGFSYTLPGGGKGKTVLRGGVQVSYLTFGRAESAISSMPGLSQEYVYRKPGGAYMNLADVKNLVPLQVPDAMKPPTLSNTPTPVAERNLSLTVFDPNIRTPYTQSLNLRLTRTIGSNLTLDLIYAGNLSRKSAAQVNLNAPNMISTGLFQALVDARAGKESPLLDKLIGKINVMGVGVTPGQQLPSAASQLRRATATYNGTAIQSLLANGNFTSLANWMATANVDTAYNPSISAAAQNTKGQLLRLNNIPENFIYANPQYSAVNWQGNMNKSNYHSMQTQITLRPTHGLMLSATYTWSKNMGYSEISDYRNRDLDYGMTGGRAHQLTSYGTLDLPFGPNRWLLSSVSPNVLGRIVGGWQMSWIYTMQSGAPATVTGDVNYLWSGNMVNQVRPFDMKSGYVSWKPGADAGTYFPQASYTTVADPQCSNTELVTRADNLNAYCTLRAIVTSDKQSDYIFVNAIPGTRGNLSRNTLNSFMQWSADGALSKSVRIAEGKTFQIRIDATNIFNHAEPAYGMVFGSSWLDLGNYNTAINQHVPFGYINGKQGSRKFQAKLRFDF
jgi:Ca-activated chloride channel homolog